MTDPVSGPTAIGNSLSGAGSALKSAQSEPASFSYTLKRQRRKTIAVHVLADASVEVRAPKWLPKHEITAFLQPRAGWVQEQRQRLLLKQARTPDYADGQRHFYLGQRYELRVIRARKIHVQLAGGALQISVTDPTDNRKVQAALERWYRLQAAALFEERLFACFEVFPDWFQDKFTLPEIT